MLFGQEHVDRYVATDGEEGHEWQGTTALILWTKGRRSGESRATPLIYQRCGDDLLLVASNGGTDTQPAWYLNLDADPDTEVQVMADRFHAHARTATPEEKPEMWQTMTKAWPDYDEYQKKPTARSPWSCSSALQADSRPNAVHRLAGPCASPLSPPTRRAPVG